MRIEIHGSVKEIPAEGWGRLAGDNPTLSRAYFLALEETGAASPETGWIPFFLSAYEGGELSGILPAYLKSHSYGEFVFDHPWAEAYERHGLQYYPKLVSSVPFTPVSGNRALAPAASVRAALYSSALELARGLGASSYHCLFPHEKEARELEESGLFLRQTVQFHWENAGYQDFEAFLKGLRHDKRKNIRRERRKLAEAGFTFERKTGGELDEADWQFFYECYLATLDAYHSPVPLSLGFFRQIGREMPANILLVFAKRDGQRIAAAFDLFNTSTLYGRSWGAVENFPGLHFEVCYYQGIEFCIEKGLRKFEGGAQGEHKLARGLMPVTTWSAHWVADPRFSVAIEDFVKRESEKVADYVGFLQESGPFRRE